MRTEDTKVGGDLGRIKRSQELGVIREGNEGVKYIYVHICTHTIVKE